MKNISQEDKFILIAYGGIAIAYSILFFYKYKHLSK
jgi:hypothetical protein